MQIISLIGYGLFSGMASFAISKGKVFEGFRESLPEKAKELFGCPFCLGFWVSLCCWLGSLPHDTWIGEFGIIWATSSISSALVFRLLKGNDIIIEESSE